MQNFRTETNTNGICGILNIDGIDICKCKMYTNEQNTWTISAWYTLKDYLHQGYGSITLKNTVQEMYNTFGQPEKIEYVWNGANNYVYDWLSKNFGAISKCPIAVQKYANDDDWDSHIYTLNLEKFLKYFDLEQEQKIIKSNDLER